MTPYAPSIYTGVAIGYVREWEFSVERGADHVKGIVLVGPIAARRSRSTRAKPARLSTGPPAHEADVRATVLRGPQRLYPVRAVDNINDDAPMPTPTPRTVSHCPRGSTGSRSIAFTQVPRRRWVGRGRGSAVSIEAAFEPTGD